MAVLSLRRPPRRRFVALKARVEDVERRALCHDGHEDDVFLALEDLVISWPKSKG